MRGLSVVLSFLLAFCIPLAFDTFSDEKNTAFAAGPTGNEYEALTTPVYDAEDITAANLVLLVRFAGDTTGDAASANPGYNAPYPYQSSANNMRTCWEYLTRLIDGKTKDSFSDATVNTMTELTFRSYLYQTSWGQHNVKSYFPQTQADGTVAYLELVGAASTYVDAGGRALDSALAADAVDAFNAAYPAYDASNLDVNDDGFIDNLTILASYGGAYVSHQMSPGATFTLGGVSPKQTGSMFTVAAERTATASSAGNFSVSTAAHEYLHTLGARDYYRDGTGEPVGYWDIMAKGDRFSWPLAYTRAQIGWTELTTVQSSATAQEFTLYAPGESDARRGNAQVERPQALKLTTGLSASEFFVVEFRASGYIGSERSLHPDGSIGASGLVVYRVNEAHKDEGNRRGNDYVYVFRDGETSQTASAGNVNTAVIAAGSWTTQDSIYGQDISLPRARGVADLSATITQGALTYSNGQNSGIVLTATAQTDSSITFTVECAVAASEDAWSLATNADGSVPDAFTRALSAEPSACFDGTNLYVAVSSGSGSAATTSVLTYDGTSWGTYAAPLNGLIDVSLIWHDDTLYALGSAPGQGGTALFCYESAGWRQVGALAASPSAFQSSMQEVAGALYVLAANPQGQMQLYQLKASGLTAVYAPVPLTNATCPRIVAAGDQPAIAAGTTSGTWRTCLYTWSGSAWQEHLLTGGAANGLDATTLNGTTYVLVQTAMGGVSQIKFFALSGANSAVQLAGFPAEITGAQSVSLVSGDKHLYVCLSSGSGGAYGVTSVFVLPEANPSQATRLGSPVQINVSVAKLVCAGKQLYCVTADNLASTVAVRTHALAADDVASSQTSGGSGTTTPATPTPTPEPTPGGSGSSGAGSSKPSSSGTSSTTTPTKPTTPQVKPTVTYAAHVQNIGDMPQVTNGKLAGTSGRSLRMESLKVTLSNLGHLTGDIQVNAHVQNIGWQGWKSKGQESGTHGRSLRIEALRIRLTGTVSSQFDVWYRTHVQNVGWTGWAKNGENCGSAGKSYRMEAVQIEITPKGQRPTQWHTYSAGKRLNSFAGSRIDARAHVQNIGWMSTAAEGSTIGTTGRALRVEALELKLVNQDFAGGLRVNTHVQNIGWQGWQGSGQLAGTSGRALRLEAVRIELTGEMATHYDIWYRTHCQNVGWTGWAKNGASCGTQGKALRMEAMQIKLVPKGEGAPGTTSRSFIS